MSNLINTVKSEIIKKNKLLLQILRQEKQIKYEIENYNNKIIDFEFSSKNIKEANKKIEAKLEVIKNKFNSIFNRNSKLYLLLSFVLLVILNVTNMTLFYMFASTLLLFLIFEVVFMAYTFGPSIIKIEELKQNINRLSFNISDDERNSLVTHYKKLRQEKEESLLEIEKEINDLKKEIMKDAKYLNQLVNNKPTNKITFDEIINCLTTDSIDQIYSM